MPPLKFERELREIAQKAEQEGYENIAIVLYSLLGAMRAGSTVDLAAACKSVSARALNEIRRLSDN